MNEITLILLTADEESLYSIKVKFQTEIKKSKTNQMDLIFYQ